MAKRLPVPAELEHLVEKRETEEDRRRQARRGEQDPRQVDLGPIGAIESAESLDEIPTTERRKERDRRSRAERRKQRRRKADP